MGIAYTSYNKLLCIVGPTATGKTDIALNIAQNFKGELVACDSRQVYRGLDLGTGKEAGQNQTVDKYNGYWILDGIKVWLYDIASYKKQYTVSDYIKDATSAIHDITGKYKLPILVGGTGFYFDSLINGIETDNIPENPILRDRLEQLNIAEIQNLVKDLSIDFFESLNNSEKNNFRRLIRKVEILEYQKSHPEQQSKKGLVKQYDILKIGLTADKNVLNQRIDTRVLKRVDQGMLEETKKLFQEGLTYQRMRELGLEYGVIADYMEGMIPTKQQFVFELQQKIKQFAKRQLTWFKRDSDIVWIDITNKNYVQKVEKMVRDWYNTKAN